MGLIILSLHSIKNSRVFAQEFKQKFEVQLADNIKVFAKKVVRRDNGNIYEAIGNVIIIHNNDTLYGQAAHFDVSKGVIEIDGNVRLINKDLTLHGSNIKYFSKTQNLEITNARLKTSLYKVIARSLKKTSEKVYVAKDAEYTTCLDCPESWSIYGDTVQVNFGEYVKVKRAVFRVKGVDFAYFPLLVFPIKTNRQTGFLLPHFRGGSSDGLAVFQPFFWAINQSMDLTLTPAYWNNRGFGGDLEYRYALNSDSIFNVNGRGLFDKKTKEEFGANKRYHYSNEIFYKFTRNLQLHFRMNDLSDVNFTSEQPDFSEDRINQTEYGMDGYASWRQSSFAFGSRFLKQKSLLVNDIFRYDDARDYSDGTVGISPGFFLSLTPLRLHNSQNNFFNLLSFGSQVEFDQFYQDSYNSSNFINNGNKLRNARRLNLSPYLDLKVFDNNIFRVSSKYQFDFQQYWFRDNEEADAYKYSGVLHSGINFEIEKIYGDASLKKTAKKLEKSKSENDQLIGEIGNYEEDFGFHFDVKHINGYKHLQKISLNHYLIPFENEFGNSTFINQINDRSGWFDFYDAKRSQEFQLGEESTRKEISKSNTIEVKWENDIIRKKIIGKDVYANDQKFTYERIAYFNVSQGYTFQNKLYDRSELTQLILSGGYRFSKKFDISAQHFYFHTSKKNISDFTIKNDFNVFKLYNRFSINDFSDRVNHKVGGDIKLFDQLVFRLEELRDLNAEEKLIDRNFTIFYLPRNKCWFVSLKYSDNAVRGSNTSFDFAINPGQLNFANKLERLF